MQIYKKFPCQPLKNGFLFNWKAEDYHRQYYGHNLHISFEYPEHPAAPSIEIAKRYWTRHDVKHCKNLFSVIMEKSYLCVMNIIGKNHDQPLTDAASFIFNEKTAWTHVGEVTLKDKSGKTAGNIDYVLISYDDKGRVLDFGSLEVQAVYISGNLTGPFSAYMENPTAEFTWTQALKYPKPDYLSSSRKRLIPQIIAKGSILKQWNKKQAVALQTSFYETLPSLPEVSKSDADFAFFLYDLYPCQKEKRLELSLQHVAYTKFAVALERIAKFEAGPLNDFTLLLQKKLDAKRSINYNATDFENIIVK